MNVDFTSLFHQHLAHEGWAPDEAQIGLSRAFDDLWCNLTKSKIPFLKRRVAGLYVYGGVGRGKTMMMDLFFDHVPLPATKKFRAHFNAFMLDVHAQLHQLQGHRNPLKLVADQIAAQTRLLCFDEFQVTDIADAMLLKGLFERLFDKGVTLVATSNVAPTDLYKDGLQRSKFVPFIDVLNTHCHIHPMVSETDYRLMTNVADRARYVTPHSSAAMAHWFSLLTQGEAGQETIMTFDGREMTLKCASQSVAWVSFSELCERPRGAADYQALVKNYPYVMIEHIPRLGYDRRNEAKRFILLIDCLYDADAFCIFSAEAAPHKLYQGHDHGFEFERTISRLIEMQSKGWSSEKSKGIIDAHVENAL